MSRTRIALLRGINIGGKKKLPMAELRKICVSLGFEDPVTYIQSGNVVFGSDREDADIEGMLKKAIDDTFGYDVPVMVRGPRELRNLVENNPFPDADPKFLAVSFLGSEPDASDFEVIASGDFGDDECALMGSAVFLHLPGGFARTKLTNNFLESRLSVPATTRNWRTVNKLLDMADARR